MENQEKIESDSLDLAETGIPPETDQPEPRKKGRKPKMSAEDRADWEKRIDDTAGTSGQELVPIENVKIPAKMHSTYWELPAHFSPEEFEQAASNLKRVEGSVQWYWGDLWLAAKHQGWWKHGEGKDYAAKLGVDYKSVRNYANVCKSFTPNERHANASFNHHRIVAAQPKAERNRWLRKANSVSVNEISKELTKAKVVAKVKKSIETGEAVGRYSVLYAAPDWENKRNHLVDFPVASYSTEDAVLYLWVPPARLIDALFAMQTWGFEYVNHLVWSKNTVNDAPWFRETHELLLVGTKGSPGIPSGWQNSVIGAPVEGNAKPAAVLEIIDQAWPDVRKLELFPAGNDEVLREGWVRFGETEQEENASE
jgi:N6-adenosine-specific RNA methylase IME4